MLFEKAIVNTYRKMLLTRQDPDGSIFYYGPEDFPDLKAEPFAFTGDKGQRLQGYFYETEVSKTGRVLVFDHGMGCGHKAYMKEIVTLARAGYLVFAYDHTGTLESEGENIGGFSQSLADLHHAIGALIKHPRCEGRSFSVVGHSWGAFSTMNIGAFFPEITHLVAISGFISVDMMLRSVLGRLSGYAPAIFRGESERFGGYAYADARLSLMETRADALIVHSSDDPIGPYSHFEALRAALGDRENITFLSVEGKGHNPNFTRDAVTYKDEFFKRHTELTKKKKLVTKEEKEAFVKSYDWERMTAQDGEFWGTVLEFLEK